MHDILKLYIRSYREQITPYLEALMPASLRAIGMHIKWNNEEETQNGKL